MRQRLLRAEGGGTGSSTIGISAVGLGGASLSFAEDRDDDRSLDLIRTAVEAGVTYLDTAAAYTTADEAGHNERLLARAVRESGRGDLVVGTKGGHYRAGNTWPIDGRPASIRRDFEGSLAALRGDAIDLYYLHWPDPEVPFAESVGALEELRAEGKVVRTGVSNVTADQLAVALGESPISAVQNTFSPFSPRDRELIRQCEAIGVVYVSYSPLGGNRERPRSVDMPRTSARATELGVSLEQLVLAWELSLSSNIVVLSGATRLATVHDSTAAGDRELDAATVDAIEADVETLSLGGSTR